MASTAQDIAEMCPVPTYRFRVTIGDTELAFSEVSGLQQTVQTIDYRDGTGHWCLMPGQRQPVNITLRRGMAKGRKELYEWYKSITLNQVDKKDILISLTDEAGTGLLISWIVSNAFPTSLSGPNFSASGNEVAMEEVNLMGDRLSIEFH
ncbi:TPA: phage tail protein [Pseudomonas aeruginosa]|nr:phage tail protein [Pseudomonas aeruginosa]